MVHEPEFTPIPWQRNGETMQGWCRLDGASERVGVEFMEHPAAIVPDEGDADFIVLAVNSHAKLLEALEECKRLAIERVGTADAAVKSDAYAADALMGIAKTALDAIRRGSGDNA